MYEMDLRIRKQIGADLRLERNLRRLTQEKVARLVGISGAKLWKLENGRIANPQSRDIQAVRDVLHRYQVK